MAKAKKKSTVAIKKPTKSTSKHSSSSKTSKPSSFKSASKKAPTVLNKDLLKSLSKPLTRTQQVAHLASTNNLPKKDVALVMNSLEQMIAHPPLHRDDKVKARDIFTNQTARELFEECFGLARR